MMEHDFLEYAGTLTTKEIDDIISKLNQVKEKRADEVRCAAAQRLRMLLMSILNLVKRFLLMERYGMKIGIAVKMLKQHLIVVLRKMVI